MPPATSPSGARSFIYMPDEQAAVVFDEGLPRLDLRHFVTARRRDVAQRQHQPQARRSWCAPADGAARVSAYADAAGRFGINVPLQADDETFDMQVIAPLGLRQQRPVRDHASTATPPRDRVRRRRRRRSPRSSGCRCAAGSRAAVELAGRRRGRRS